MWLLDFRSICHDVSSPWALSLHIPHTIATATANYRNTDLAGPPPRSRREAKQDDMDLAYLIV